MRRLSISRTSACIVAVLALGALTASAASANGGYGGNGNGNGNGRGDDHGRHHQRFDRHHHRRHHQPPVVNHDPGYSVQALVSDQPGVATHTDPNLVNGWGISEGPTTPWWVSNQGTDTSTLYDGVGTPQALVVSVAGGPTGTVFNGGTGFLVSNGTTDVAARFIFATLAGTIEAWPTPPPAGTITLPKVDESASHAVFTGLAISPDNSTLYAADFSLGKVETFDSTWASTSMPGAFVDPYLPAGYAPFGIQVLNGEVFVTYAKQPATPGPEVHGPGLGIVDEYSLAGVWQQRVGSFGGLNAPWGLAWAPATGFGSHSGELLVGNFGDGHVNVFFQRPWGWSPDGQLTTSNHHPLVIDGLWGIGFGNGTTGPTGQPTNTLYFAAGPDGGTHGLFGTVTANP
jgi:uncharacterized protein (TIGR03118 family)